MRRRGLDLPGRLDPELREQHHHVLRFGHLPAGGRFDARRGTERTERGQTQVAQTCTVPEQPCCPAPQQPATTRGGPRRRLLGERSERPACPAAAVTSWSPGRDRSTNILPLAPGRDRSTNILPLAPTPRCGHQTRPNDLLPPLHRCPAFGHLAEQRIVRARAYDSAMQRATSARPRTPGSVHHQRSAVTRPDRATHHDRRGGARAA
jgi:hypothetical protein